MSDLDDRIRQLFRSGMLLEWFDERTPPFREYCRANAIGWEAVERAALRYFDSEGAAVPRRDQYLERLRAVL